MSRPWISGNQFTLLENGEAFFPRVFDTIAAARHEVLIETFILREDKVGKALRMALLKAARRGVQADVTVDGYGSQALSPEFVAVLAAAGVRVHVFAPVSRFVGRISYFRRMHRKLIVVDGERAFTGGINFGAEQLADYGPQAKQDYAVEIEGPVVSEIHRFMHAAMAAGWRGQPPASNRCALQNEVPAPSRAGADALFVWRDNGMHRDDIERHYRLALRLARQRAVIANAYFFPGYSFLRDLCHAARHGVEVSLILQGKPDMPIARACAMLYDQLLRDGVRIYEYGERPLHGKVALVDDEWATVGSSNLDPLSLAFNLEANVMIRDRAFNEMLHERLQRLMAGAIEMPHPGTPRPGIGVREKVLSQLLRRYPGWVSRLPAHAPRLTLVQPAARQVATDVFDEAACP